jgi:hypothetical protein
MKYRIYGFLFFTSIGVFAQSSKITTKSQGTGLVIASSANVATLSGVVYTYSIGEAIIFTGANPNGFLTQGFQQPMICKDFPVIAATNQQSCSLPYTLQVTAGFNKYQWKVGNSIIASGRDAVYNPVKDGSYTVLVGDSTGCVLNASPISVDLSAKNIVPTIAVYGLNVVTDTLLVSSPAATYQWYVILEDGSHKVIMGATTISYRPLFRATYYVQISTADNCVAYSVPYILNNANLDPLSKADLEIENESVTIKKRKRIIEHKLEVFPIPSRDKFTVRYESPEKNTVFMKLYNVLGVVVSLQSIKNENGQFDFNYERGDLPSGKYILDVVDGDKKSIQNLILE